MVACQSKSAYESARENLKEYNAILSEAENSSITELKKPDGFCFDMTESQFDETLAQRESQLIDSLTKNNYKSGSAQYDWLLGTNHYAVGEIYSKDFQKDKLCSYKIEIKERIVNDEFEPLDENDIDNICDFYKAFFEKDYTFASLTLPVFGQTNVFSKNNMAITITNVIDSYKGTIEITYENRPVTAPIERERDAKYRAKHEESSSATISTVEVKNNLYDEGLSKWRII